ncbi:hypothetical protein BH11PSE5_BH11PSE5_25930 [soil metagenome]|jgi:DNA repair protein RadC|uniref:JAB domain-containing protein n=1 Tax=Sphingobium sp. BS19 TaxID=3018973 RepID=UPI0022EE08FC|nr:JAB domain-containing protein [Sphingobium sp. BS19]GLI99177.1 hypothetical protein Sbs19_29950 [Sphingobium sp. BS19]
MDVLPLANALQWLHRPGMRYNGKPIRPKHTTDTVETAIILLLDAKGHTLDRLEYAGGTDQLRLPWRDIVLQALIADCRGAVLMHNHPSGDPNPSDADIQVTRMLCRMLRMLEMKLLDHIIVTTETSFSFRENGLL